MRRVLNWCCAVRLLASLMMLPAFAAGGRAQEMLIRYINAEGDALAESALEQTPPVARSFRRVLLRRIFFFTNRRMNPDEMATFNENTGVKNLDSLFDETSGAPLFGTAEIAFPANRELGQKDEDATSKDENPFINFSVMQFALLESPSDFVTILSKSINLSKSSKSVTIYVHGLNNTFSESIKAAAQLQADLETPAVIAFSWPSYKQSIDLSDAYTHASLELQRAKPYLTYLSSAVRLAGSRRPDLISHSLGGRLTFEAYQDLIKDSTQVNGREFYRLGHAIFVAPDVDLAAFITRGKSFDDAIGGTISVYCANDVALRFSKFWSGGNRLGFCPDRPIVIAGVRNIRVVGNMIDIKRHSYFLQSKEMVLSLRGTLSRDPRENNKEGVRFDAETIELH